MLAITLKFKRQATAARTIFYFLKSTQKQKPATGSIGSRRKTYEPRSSGHLLRASRLLSRDQSHDTTALSNFVLLGCKQPLVVLLRHAAVKVARKNVKTNAVAWRIWE
jgi:hypothetical protein